MIFNFCRFNKNVIFQLFWLLSRYRDPVIIFFSQKYFIFHKNNVMFFTIFFLQEKILYLYLSLSLSNYQSYKFAVIFLCVAAVIFPIGFAQEEIGGASYQLPNEYQVR